MPLLATAGDWPQILGPGRDGVAVDERITTDWPSGGPEVLWRQDAGSGFAGVSVRGELAILFHRIGDREIVEALQASTGASVWRAAFRADYVPTFTKDTGPRAVPVIDRGRVYVYGAKGGLRCLEATTGAVLWQRDTYAEFNSKKTFRGEPPEGYFGLGSSPIVEGDKVMVNVGGDADGAGIVAFATDTGRTVWKATSERASYSSPVAVTIDGVRHVIFVTRLSVVSLDPETGHVRFQFPFGRPGPTVNAANPVILNRHLFVTASYGVGSVLAEVRAGDAEVLWRGRNVFGSQYATCIQHEGYLFGIDGRQDGPPGDLKCFDPRTRTVAWTQEAFGYATLLKADDKLLVFKTDGELVVAALDVTKYAEIARAHLFDTTTRALPALANGLLYARGTRELRCFDLRRNR